MEVKMPFVVFVKRSVRFPGKHSYMIGGKSLLEIIVSKLSNIGKVYVFTKDKDIICNGCSIEFDTTNGIITDSVLAAIDKFGTFFAVAGDMPLIKPELVSKMLSQYKGSPLFPRHMDGMLEPLFGIYTEDLYNALKEYLDKGGESLHAFLLTQPLQYYDIGSDDEVNFININYKSDIEKYRDLLVQL
ncbi:molybdopterin-guanine dinucleotide biosynthesis protein A [Thermoplasma volcanium GSS1]|uniref:Molybdopterin-guanine dinucleotide biosynthesis protein A n=1 Tax=Thermoplasma volcanium (strain ATCC 51530 / DSM 4299 / JCM 9571 / NBRC 15438 / GSS1) TaxID=273116 RepID=Q978X2_THEVO|nr:molybdenum cofactor guanylyltransferase [Thermoplasma volcanium]BAB60435.1 molybdopterin-guanine dinucleotide biosynthesis protein A [Thermoplasma volcanium GSS1]